MEDSRNRKIWLPLKLNIAKNLMDERWISTIPTPTMQPDSMENSARQLII